MLISPTVLGSSSLQFHSASASVLAVVDYDNAAGTHIDGVYSAAGRTGNFWTLAFAIHDP
eukprot:COSAG01_NODE_1450_length_10270_cov_8.297218_1_plen_60_part_00